MSTTTSNPNISHLSPFNSCDCRILHELPQVELQFTILRALFNNVGWVMKKKKKKKKRRYSCGQHRSFRHVCVDIVKKSVEKGLLSMISSFFTFCAIYFSREKVTKISFLENHMNF